MSSLTMTADYFNISSPFASKGEFNDDIVMDCIDNDLSLMPLPSINDSVIADQSNNEYLTLTQTVRTTYFSHLHKCLLNNYETCYEGEEDDGSTIKIKKCADQMELHAVKLALETQLYRQNMLRLIRDVKSHTIDGKAYETLVIFLEEPKNTFDVAVQTDKTWEDLYKTDNTKGTDISPNGETTSPTASLARNLSSLFEDTNVSEDLNNERDAQQEILKTPSNTLTTCFNDTSQRTEAPPQLTNDITVMKNDDEDSQDSLLQHMEDMFGESDDSSDLTKLIEKHSDRIKVNSNINHETNKKCLETDINGSSNLWGISEATNIPDVTRVNTSKNKLSFHSYKERQRKSTLSKTDKDKSDEHDSVSEQQQRINAVWFVERVHQVSKFKAKMAELSLRNYRKHRKIKEKFLYLFGDCDDEEMMPDSPICIEEYLPACKDRIAPWIVKYLMPFYKKKRIKNRHLFKAAAKYITDMLIIESTFPEEISVSKYIKDYFKNGKCIKIKQDIFL